MPIDVQNIGQMLSGMGQGLLGQGPQFQRNLMLQRQLEDNDNANREAEQKKLAAERQKTLFTDAEAQLRFAKEGRWDLVGQLAQSRLQLSENFPGVDFSATKQLAGLAQYAEQGSEEARSKIMSTLENGVEIGRAYGVLAPQEGPKHIGNNEGQALLLNPDGSARAVPIEGYVPGEGGQKDRDLRARELDIREQKLKQERAELASGGGGGKITPSQRANNEEIVAARKMLRGMKKEDVMRRSQPANAMGRDNPDYDPYIEGLVKKATQRKIGDDPHFEKVYSNFYGSGEAGRAPASEGDAQIQTILQANPGKDASWAKAYLEHLKANGGI